jgi:hypothetical protein
LDLHNFNGCVFVWMFKICKIELLQEELNGVVR